MSVRPPGIKYSLGADKEKRHILSSLCLTFMIFIYFFVMGSSLPIRIYTFQNRVTYDYIFNTHITNLTGDIFILLSLTIVWVLLSINGRYIKSITTIFFSGFLVLLLLNITAIAQVGALVTLPLLFSFIIVNKFRNMKILRWDESLSRGYIVLAAILLASLGIISLLISIIAGSPTVSMEKYPYEIYHKILSTISPIIMIGLVFCVPLKILINNLIVKLKIKKDLELMNIVEERLSKNRVRWYLVLVMVLALSLAFIPHLSSTNPNNERLGVDSSYYVAWINMIKNQSSDLIRLVFKDISLRRSTTNYDYPICNNRLNQGRSVYGC